MFDGQNAVPANIVNRTQRGHFQSRQRSSKIVIQVEPGKPRAEVSKREKNYKPKKEFAYRMRAGRPIGAMAVPFGGGWLCFRSALVAVM